VGNYISVSTGTTDESMQRKCPSCEMKEEEEEEKVQITRKMSEKEYDMEVPRKT
jgi:hypothetical protein